MPSRGGGVRYSQKGVNQSDATGRVRRHAAQPRSTLRRIEDLANGRPTPKSLLELHTIRRQTLARQAHRTTNAARRRSIRAARYALRHLSRYDRSHLGRRLETKTPLEY